jgi:hypothetical protein
VNAPWYISHRLYPHERGAQRSFTSLKLSETRNQAQSVVGSQSNSRMQAVADGAAGLQADYTTSRNSLLGAVIRILSADGEREGNRRYFDLDSPQIALGTVTVVRLVFEICSLKCGGAKKARIPGLLHAMQLKGVAGCG